MSDAMIKYAQQLRRLIDDYYHQQMTMAEYRAQRKEIFDHIESELAGRNMVSETRTETELDESPTHS